MSNGNYPQALDFRIGTENTLLFLVRHGQTAWNVERRFQGQLDVPLSPIGLGQAKRLADWLSGLPVRFSAIYTSDLSRAAATAEAVGAKVGVAPTNAQALKELNVGAWQGLNTDEVEALYPGQLREWREHIEQFTLPGGESVPEVGERVFRYVSDVVRRHKGEAVIVVSHGAALSAYLAAVQGWGLQETWDSRRARMSNTGVTALDLGDAGPPRMLICNSTAHLTTPADLPSVIDPTPSVDKSGFHAEFTV